jgi:hypothetical protein
MQEVIFLRTWAVSTGEATTNCGSCSISEKEYPLDGTSSSSVSERCSPRAQCRLNRTGKPHTSDRRFGR